MASIVYLQKEKELEVWFCTLLDTFPPTIKLEVIHSLNALWRRLRKPYANVNVAVLFAMNRQEFLKIVSMRDLLVDVKIIFVLPDQERETILLAHTLSPRFVTWLDCDFSNVSTVLQRMVKLYDTPPDLRAAG